jgi:hypothetical protein
MKNRLSTLRITNATLLRELVTVYSISEMIGTLQILGQKMH